MEADVRRAGVDQPQLRLRLYPYQVEGVAFLASRGRALLADDMGLGKTAQAIAALAHLRRSDDVRRALVVCPASLKHQWQREILRCLALGLGTKETAERLKLSAKTVSNHHTALKTKLQISEPAGLVHYAIKHGLVKAP